MSGVRVGAYLDALADMIVLRVVGVDLNRLLLLFRGVAVTGYLAGSASGSLCDAHADLPVTRRSHDSFVVDGVMGDCIQ